MRHIKIIKSILLILSLFLITSCANNNTMKPEDYKNKKDFIQKYIFPGGFLPNKNSINRFVSENDLTINSYISYADHYANTLAIWRKEFLEKWELIKNQGFDLTFKRMWEFYLAYCEAGFKSKNIDLIQFSMQKK